MPESRAEFVNCVSDPFIRTIMDSDSGFRWNDGRLTHDAIALMSESASRVPTFVNRQYQDLLDFRIFRIELSGLRMATILKIL